MPDSDDLDRGLLALAAHLEDESRPVDPDAAMARVPTHKRSFPWRVTVAVAAVAVLVVGVVAVTRPSEEHRDVAATSGETTPAPTPTTVARYTGVPYDQLPDGGIAIAEGNDPNGVTLYGFDGTELGRAPAPAASQIGSRPGLQTLAVRADQVVELASPDPAQAPPGCDEAAGAGGLRVALCGGEEQGRASVVAVTPTGQVATLVRDAPGGTPGHGHWRWAVPSPDGHSVLAQWSGECEVPTAYVISRDFGSVRPVDGATGAFESTGLGWAPDGRAVVQFYGGACGEGVPTPGVYLVDPTTFSRTLVRATDPTARVTTWTRHPNEPDVASVLSRALRELGLPACCQRAPQDEGDLNGGARWQGADIAIGSRPSSRGSLPYVWFNDSVLDSASAEIGGAPATVGTFDGGPFAAYTCGERVWTFNGGSPDVRPTAKQLTSLAAELLPHLYCTVGARPDASGHGVP